MRAYAGGCRRKFSCKCFVNQALAMKTCGGVTYLRYITPPRFYVNLAPRSIGLNSVHRPPKKLQIDLFIFLHLIYHLNISLWSWPYVIIINNSPTLALFGFTIVTVELCSSHLNLCNFIFIYFKQQLRILGFFFHFLAIY